MLIFGEEECALVNRVLRTLSTLVVPPKKHLQAHRILSRFRLLPALVPLLVSLVYISVQIEVFFCFVEVITISFSIRDHYNLFTIASSFCCSFFFSYACRFSLNSTFFSSIMNFNVAISSPFSMLSS